MSVKFDEGNWNKTFSVKTKFMGGLAIAKEFL